MAVVTINPRKVDTDDSGDNLSGTIHNNAWLQDLQDRIDAAFAKIPVTLLAKGSVNAVSGLAVTLLTVVMPPLTVDDTIEISCSIFQGGAAGNGLYIGIPADVVFVRLDDIGTGRTMNANESGFWQIRIREQLVNPAVFDSLAWGGLPSQPGGIRTAVAQTTAAANWNNGGWTLALMGNQLAGASTYASWHVRKL